MIESLRSLLRKTYLGPIVAGMLLARGLSALAVLVGYNIAWPLFGAYYYERGFLPFRAVLNSFWGPGVMYQLSAVLFGLIGLLMAFWLYRDTGTTGPGAVSMRVKE